MGIYYYSLRTKSRRFKIAGEMEEVYSVEFAFKNEPQHYQRTEARMEKVWERRDPPKYIAFGGFGDEGRVYKGWPKNTITVSEFITNSLDFVGVLRGEGRNMWLEEWTPVPVEESQDPQFIHFRIVKILNDLGIDRENFVVQTPPDRKTTTVYFKYTKDAVIGRVALA